MLWSGRARLSLPEPAQREVQVERVRLDAIVDAHGLERAFVRRAAARVIDEDLTHQPRAQRQYVS